jgi:hypothetical protein
MKKNVNMYDDTLNNVRTYSRPSDLRITDIRFADIVGAPMHCILMKIETNQGIVGYGEVRDWSCKDYALMLKSRLLGENPCEIDKLFRKIKPLGTHSRGAGGVCGVELALWDIAGKAYGIPAYQMLGGKHRDKIRVYADTDIDGKPDGKRMGEALKSRLDKGFTLVKMDLGIDLLYDVPGALCAPTGIIDDIRQASLSDVMSFKGTTEERYLRHRRVYPQYIPHPQTGIQITELGLDWLEQYCQDIRSIIGYDVPIAIDHLGHIGVNEAIKLGKRIEKYNIAWMEDAIPWQFTEQYKLLQSSINIPVCTGEDIYCHEDFVPLIKSGGVSIIHPDILTSGGLLETKKISDIAGENGVAMAIHMAESPIAAMAAANLAAACDNFLALEFHSHDVEWWDDLVSGPSKPIVNNGFITLDDCAPGLGIAELNDEVIKEHLHPDVPGIWESTEEWNDRYVYDRIWS